MKPTNGKAGLMKNMLMVTPLAALILMMAGCGGGGGTADPNDIGNAVFKAITSKDWDNLTDLMDPMGSDRSALAKVTEWKRNEKYESWKEYKKRLEGDGGMDPKSKSGIDGEDKWKSMSEGKSYALEQGLYRLYANDDLDKRLGDVPWAMAGSSRKLDIEGQGRATVYYSNVYGDSIEVSCTRRDGLWYLSGIEVKMDKELPPKIKDE
jgi:hypothetical protein